MKVSTCRSEITPTKEFLPCYLSGHAIRTELSNGIINPLWAGERQKRFPDNKVILFSKRMFASLIFFSHLYNFFVIDHIFMYVSLQHEIKFPSSS